MTGSPAPSRRMPYLLMRIYAFFAGALRHNRLVFRFLFGYTPPRDIDGHLWDWTTLALRRALRRCGRPGAGLLDMGTGPVAVLGIYARSTLGYGYVCAADHIPEIVSHARRTALIVRSDIDIVESSLFDAVTGRYDVISFNAPYIDEASGIRLGLLNSDTAVKRWSGGGNGLETIDRFLAAAGDFLEMGGIVLLGVNLFYIRRDEVEDRAAHSGWSVARVIRNRWSRAAVFTLMRSGERARRGR